MLVLESMPTEEMLKRFEGTSYDTELDNFSVF